MKTTKKNKTDKTRQKPTKPVVSEFDQLEAQDQAIVNMRVDGYEPRHIKAWLESKKLTQKEGTIRDWFCPTGRLYKALQEKEAEKKLYLRNHTEVMRELIAVGAKDAFLSLVRSSQKGSVIASKTLLDMAGFGAALKIDGGESLMFEVPKDDNQAELQAKVLTKLYDYIKTNKAVLANEDRNAKS